MVPDKFNMVDMEGIDLIESQGTEVPGLYEKLVESIALCRYQCIYNWKFDGIIIPPTYVEMVATDEEVSINGGVTVDVDDVVHIESLVIIPVLEPLSVIENGTYTPQEGVDGFSTVEVEINPVIEPLEVSENGVYTTPEGIDGYSPVTVNISSENPMLTPDYQGLSHSYLAQSGDFYQSNEGEIYFINCFHLTAGKEYAIFIGSVTSSRNRCAFFVGKSITDFIQYIESGSGAITLIYSSSNTISSGDPNSDTRFVFSPASDGELLLVTSNASVQAIGYCVEI